MRTATVEDFSDKHLHEPIVRGFLHRPPDGFEEAIILTHAAASNCQSPLLVALATAFSADGIAVLRCDLPFRLARPNGRPPASYAARDQAGLRRAIELIKAKVSKKIYLGGHAYGGRQSSLLAASDPNLVAGLLLLSYPLHPPRQSTPLRTHHFSLLRTPAMFVQASKDPFGTPDEVGAALSKISAPTKLVILEGGRHELLSDGNSQTLADTVVREFREFFGLTT